MRILSYLFIALLLFGCSSAPIEQESHPTIEQTQVVFPLATTRITYTPSPTNTSTHTKTPTLSNTPTEKPTITGTSTATPLPEVINYPGITDSVSWKDAVDLSAEDCDQQLMQELRNQYGTGDGSVIYFTRLLAKAFNIEVGGPPGYDVPSSEINHWLGIHHPDNSCYILWAVYHNVAFLVYPNEYGQTVIIPVTDGP
jgi:hypothetical protein